ncbi:uncharacterized protein CIMG_13016 [Coccidioides immitis RS]|uniref:Uncharacterized protein n=1 Tax=Coccidioides immitis (strain RS) TaxID=246410 RepID=J3K7E9_COCIM|nr:uncharacterized protein CIMG_13016 [Coccidioides immitis RS]EAS30620.3 hypothetical protein CIMG_13016 [Coccidioides immitis RS]
MKLLSSGSRASFRPSWLEEATTSCGLVSQTRRCLCQQCPSATRPDETRSQGESVDEDEEEDEEEEELVGDPILHWRQLFTIHNSH